VNDEREFYNPTTSKSSEKVVNFDKFGRHGLDDNDGQFIQEPLDYKDMLQDETWH
jgi:hypothetical protein